MEITLKFLNMDSRNRPVYKDETGTLWKDVNPRRQYASELCTSNGNNIDGEPDVPMSYMKKYENAEIQFTSERILWN